MCLSVGASDGNPNPVKFAFLAGIGGKGVVPGRPQDSFGVGIARTQFSGAFIPFLRENLTSTLHRRWNPHSSPTLAWPKPDKPPSSYI